MEMMLGILPILIPLIRPIHPYIRIEYLPPIQSRQRLICRTHVGVFDETVIEASMLEISILDDFRLNDGSGDGEDLGEHVVGHSRGEIADVEMGFLRCFGVLPRGDPIGLVGGHDERSEKLDERKGGMRKSSDESWRDLETPEER